MKHTQACIEETNQWAAIKAAFIQAWPDQCNACQGHGGVSTYYPGTRLDPPETDWTGCPQCYEKGNCPRCGAVIITPEELATDDDFADRACPACGWICVDLAADLKPYCEGRNPPYSIPEAPECWCEFDNLEREAQE